MQSDFKLPFHLLVRRARRDAGISQVQLAEKVGCNQSQISAFESGVPGKVARETVLKIAENLGLEPPPEEQAAPVVSGLQAAAPSRGFVQAVPFCPNFECLSNFPYFVGEQLLFLPLGSSGCGARCAVCGEILSRECPVCKARTTGRGGCCETCGNQLVSLPDGVADDPRVWASAHRAAACDYAAALAGCAAPGGFPAAAGSAFGVFPAANPVAPGFAAQGGGLGFPAFGR